MTRWAIVDTGPLVAALDRRELYHAWAVEQIHRFNPPLLVCEPVLVEALFLLSRLPDAQDGLLEWLENGALRVGFRLEEHVQTVRALCRKYRDVPMSLADGCLVRMAEIYGHYGVCTLDSDFTIYRKHGREAIPLIAPPGVGF